MTLRKWFTFLFLMTCSSFAAAQPSPLPPVNTPTSPVNASSSPAALPPVTLPASPSATTGSISNSPTALPATAIPPNNAVQTMDNAATPALTTALPLTPATEEKFIGSMGKSPISIFFTPLQTRAMKEALEEYESKPVAKTAADSNLEVDLAAQDKKEAPKLVEPEIYPVFYLSSIAYHSPHDWSIWVSGHKITSDSNKTDLAVLSVNENQASFSWKPKFNKAIVTRKEKNIFAPVEAGLKNKLTAKPNFHYNTEEGTFTFTLRTNQTFAVAYMNTFEGFLASPKLPALPVDTKTEASEPITASNLQPNPTSSTGSALKNLSTTQATIQKNPELQLGTRPLTDLLKQPQPTSIQTK